MVGLALIGWGTFGNFDAGRTVSEMTSSVRLRLTGVDDSWNSAELSLIRSLWLESLPPLPPDPTNRYADDLDVARFGQRLFFDQRLSANGQVACASCHLPKQQFTDPFSVAQNGVAPMEMRTMPLAGTAYSPWYFWDGRKDSQWAQALDPWESRGEHGANRMQLARLMVEHYAADYEALFGPLPDFSDETRYPAVAGPIRDNPVALTFWDGMGHAEKLAVTEVFVNMGKAVAAYERQLTPQPSRFDEYARRLLEDAGRTGRLFSADEKAGLQLFIGAGNCIDCHNGPLFTNNDFHATGVRAANGQTPLDGRLDAIGEVLHDEFNCFSRWSDAAPDACLELRFLKTEGHELSDAWRTPTLRGVSDRPPYMHQGQFATLTEVLAHYNEPPPSTLIAHNDLQPLGLSAEQLRQLEAFLATLSPTTPIDATWLAP